MPIEVPDRALATFTTRLPGPEELGGILQAASGGVAWAAAGARDAVEIFQLGQGAWVDLLRRVDVPSLPPGVQEASAALWDLAPTFQAARTVGDVKSAMREVVGPLVRSSLSAAASAMGSVPIVGWIVSFFDLAWKVGRTIWTEANEYEGPYVLAPRYDPDTDAATIQEALDLMRGEVDWSWIWQPYAIGEIYSARVQGGRNLNRAWAIEGPRTGTGAVPGAARIWRAWYFDTDTPYEARPHEAAGKLPPGSDPSYRRSWGAYHPGAESAYAALWDRLQAPSRAAFQIDRIAIRSAWVDWAKPLRAHAEAGDDWTNRRAASVLWPAWAQWLGIPPDYWEVHPHYGKPVPSVVSVVSYMMHKHGQRQADLLGTLTCAYVSESDPAFRQPGLRHILTMRRRQLLGHKAVLDVDPSACPDPEYRTRLRQAWSAALPVSARPGDEPPEPAPAAEPPPLPADPDKGLPPGRVPPPELPPLGPPGPGPALLLAAIPLLL